MSPNNKFDQFEKYKKVIGREMWQEFKIMKSKNVMTVSKFSESKHCFPACTPARFDKNFYRVSVSFGVVVVDFHAQGK